MSDQPVLKFMFTTKGAINLAFGAGMLAMPAQLLHLYGLSLDPAGELVGRLFGAALLGIGIAQFVGRNSSRSGLQSLLVGAFAIADLIGSGLAIQAVLAGLLNEMGWAVAGLYAFAGLGFTLAWLKEGRQSVGASSPATTC